MQAMPGDLAAWCTKAAPGECRTFVLKLAPTADVERLTAGLRAIGVEIVSAGPAATVVRMDGEAAQNACELDGVIAVEAPRRLFPRTVGSGSAGR